MCTGESFSGSFELKKCLRTAVVLNYNLQDQIVNVLLTSEACV